ncbi:2TM domain-containing protein [Leptolyngbya sp. GB1-A1]|uniref:2TM domain-containing protein n=1 Tax=Leptolyngbya sp. GB1-A1 TaxID=2933908 RepID=UPI003299F17F
MPPRWSRKPDRKDADYRKLDDRMNFAVHVASFIAVNSGVWFAHNLQQADWEWISWLTGLWGLVLAAHAIYIFTIADYSEATPAPTLSKKE